MAGLSKFKSIVDFGWSEKVFKRKADLQAARDSRNAIGPWSLDLGSQGLMRDGGMAVLVGLLPFVAPSLTYLDLR